MQNKKGIFDMDDNKLLKLIHSNLQNLNEKKKKKYSKPFKDQDGDGKITRKDVLIARGVDLDEEAAEECSACGHVAKGDDTNCEMCNEPLNKNLEDKKKKKKKKTDFDPGGQAQYRAGRSQKQIDTQADLTRKYNAAKTEKQKQRYRDMIDRTRSKEGTNENLIRITRNQLSELINEVVEAEKLIMMLEKIEELEEKKKKSKKKKKKKGGGLSAAVKKSLDKKADRRGLTRGSVYSEFRKGLAAYYSSGSRKGMSAHQWAHARVNSANPSKSWAVVKKRKGGKKKKKK